MDYLKNMNEKKTQKNYFYEECILEKNNSYLMH